MARNYYSEINLHLVWHTKLSQPLLTSTVEVTDDEEAQAEPREAP